MNDRRLAWGQNLAAARVAGGFATQEAFATILGVSQQSVSSWERGSNAPADDLKVRIAAALNLDPHQLFPLVEAAS